MGGLDLGAVGQPDAKAIVHRLPVFTRGVEAQAVAGASGVVEDIGGTWGN